MSAASPGRRKTDLEREQINARIAMKRGPREKRIDILLDLAERGGLTRDLLQAFAQTERAQGFAAGVDDVTNGD